MTAPSYLIPVPLELWRDDNPMSVTAWASAVYYSFIWFREEHSEKHYYSLAASGKWMRDMALVRAACSTTEIQEHTK